MTMSRREVLALLALAATPVLAGCSPRLPLPAGADSLRSDATRETAQLPSTIPSVFGTMGFRLLPSGKNGSVSPLSIITALQMVRNGATGAAAGEMDRLMEGSTEETNGVLNAVLAAYVGASGSVKNGGSSLSVEADVANALWLQQGFPIERPFLDALARHFGAGVELIDFMQTGTARSRINGWGNQATRGLVPEMLPASSPLPNTKLLLANALYLSTPWKGSPVDAGRKPFQTDGGSVDAPMLRGPMGRYGTTGDLEVGAFPLLGGFTMWFLKPKQTVRQTVAGLGKQGLAALASAGGPPSGSTITFPSWKNEYKVDVIGAFGDLGIGGLASVGAKPLEGISPNKQLAVASVPHTSVVEVNAKGFRGAATTVVQVTSGSAPGGSTPPKPIHMVLDRSFAFAVTLDVQRLSVPVFVGQVIDPTQS